MPEFGLDFELSALELSRVLGDEGAVHQRIMMGAHGCWGGGNAKATAEGRVLAFSNADLFLVPRSGAIEVRTDPCASGATIVLPSDVVHAVQTSQSLPTNYPRGLVLEAR